MSSVVPGTYGGYASYGAAMPTYGAASYGTAMPTYGAASYGTAMPAYGTSMPAYGASYGGGYGGYGGAHPMDVETVKTQQNDAMGVLSTQFGVQEKMLKHQHESQIKMLEKNQPAELMEALSRASHELQANHSKFCCFLVWSSAK